MGRRARNEESGPASAGLIEGGQLSCHVSALRIPGQDIATEPRDQKKISGRIVDIIEDTMRFLHIHLPYPHTIHGIEPEAETEIPVVALREILVNAVAHRDYTISGPIRVIVFDDRVEIRTPGILPNTVTVDSLKTGMHVLRNPTMYNILLKWQLITDAGSGIPRTVRVMVEKTGREPEFAVENQEFVARCPARLTSSELHCSENCACFHC